MARTTLVVSGLAVGLGALALGWAARADHAGRPASPRAVTDVPAAAPSRDDERAVRTVAIPLPRAAPTAEPEAPPRETAEAAQAKALQRVALFDRSFRDEPRDAAWAAQMEPVIQQALATGNYPGTRTIDASCRTTFCRIEVEHDDADGADAFEDIRHHVPGSFYLKKLPDDASGHSRTVAYFIRDERARENVIFQEFREPSSAAR